MYISREAFVISSLWCVLIFTYPADLQSLLLGGSEGRRNVKEISLEQNFLIKGKFGAIFIQVSIREKFRIGMLTR